MKLDTTNVITHVNTKFGQRILYKGSHCGIVYPIIFLITLHPNHFGISYNCLFICDPM